MGSGVHDCVYVPAPVPAFPSCCMLAIDILSQCSPMPGKHKGWLAGPALYLKGPKTPTSNHTTKHVKHHFA